MESSAEHQPIDEIIAKAITQERRRCIGMVLNAYGCYKAGGYENICKALDALATAMEQNEPEYFIDEF